MLGFWVRVLLPRIMENGRGQEVRTGLCRVLCRGLYERSMVVAGKGL